MEPISLTILFKGSGMLLSLLAGIIAIRYGYNLYKDGAGLGKDKLAFEWGGLNFTAHSVGSVVMSTAFLWGVIAISLSPSYTDGDISVYSKIISANVLDDFYFVSESVEKPEKIIDDSEALKEIFVRVAHSNVSGSSNKISINSKGEPVRLSLDTTSYLRSEDGQYYITANAETDTEIVRVAFVPTVNALKQIVFKPEGFSKVIQKNKDISNE